MIHDATVEVTCDGERCRSSIIITLQWKYRNFSPSSGFYDVSDEAVDRKLRQEAWVVQDGKHYCEECVPTAQAGERK